MKGRFSTDGFTLIELMIVVAVVAILAAIAIPSYLGIQKKAARNEAKSNLEAISLALEGFMAENNEYGDPAAAYPQVYTYVCGAGCPGGVNFGHPGNIEDVSNLGNELLYEYQITVSTAAAFGVSAIPMAGSRVEGDITLWLRSDGVKGPAGAGW